MARNSNVLLRLTGDSSEARRAVREVRQDLQRLSREETKARIDIQTRGVEAQIAKIREQLDRLGKQSPSPKVDIAIAAATAKLDRFERKLDHLNLKRVSVDVDVRRGALERVSAGLGTVERRLSSLGTNVRVGRIPFIGAFINFFTALPGLIATGIKGVIDGLSALGSFASSVASVFSSAFQSIGAAIKGLLNGTTDAANLFASFGEAVLGLIAQGPAVIATLGIAAVAITALVAAASAAVVALNAVIGAIIALGGALVALVASAAAAAAGLGALAIAFGAVLGPVLLVGIALVQRFIAVMQARKAQQQALTSAVQNQKAAEQQHKQALDQVAQAEQNLSQVTVAGRKAAAQSIIDERNAQLALEDSQLGLKGARLGVLDAKKQLRDLISAAGVAGPALNSLIKKFTSVDFDPSKIGRVIGAVSGAGGHATDPLALAHAILNLQQAQQGVKDAVNQTGNAERALGDATKRRTEFAQKGLKAYQPYNQALHQVAQSEDRLRQSQDKVSHAQAVYDQKLKGLSSTQRGFLAQLDPFITKLKALADLVTKPIFAGLESAMQSMTKLFSNSGIQTAMQSIGTAIGHFFATLGREFTSRDWVAAFQQFAAAGARMVGVGGQGFIALLRILREIARTALPALERAAQGVVGWLGRIAGQPARIHHAVQTVVDQFRIWSRFAGAVARVVINLFEAAAPAGRSLAVSMTRIVNHWADWIHDNPGKVRAFFRDAVEKTKDIANAIKNAVIWLKDHLPGAARAAANALGPLAKIVAKIYHDAKGVNDEVHGRLGAAAHEFDPGGQRLGNPSKSKGSFGSRLLHDLLGFASGGSVPGIGSGDTVPAMLTPGEFVIRKSVASQLGIPLLQALNGGGPVLSAPGVGGVVQNFNTTFEVPRNEYPDPRTYAAKLERELRLAG